MLEWCQRTVRRRATRRGYTTRFARVPTRRDDTLLAAVFLHVSCLLPPSLPSPPSLTVLLLPPTRRVVSHALYLEARREERVSRALILARIVSASQKYVTLIFISATSSPRDDVSFILAVAMCGPP